MWWLGPLNRSPLIPRYSGVASSASGLRRLAVAERRSGLGDIVIIPEPKRAEFFRLRPDLVQGVTLEELPVFHHPVNGVAVVNVVERTLVEDDEVGELAGLDGADFAGTPDDVSAVDGGAFEDFKRSHAAAGDHPHFPVIAETLQLPVAADANEGAVPRKLGDLRGELRKRVFILAEPFRAALGLFVDDAMRREVVQLGIVVNFAVLVPIILAERSAVVDDKSWSGGDAGFREDLQHIVVERSDGQGV